MGRLNWRNACLAAALAAAAAMPAAAQDSDDDGWWPHWRMGQMMQGWGGMGGPMAGYGPGAMLDRIDGRLAFLKAELKITDDQLPAWEALASTIRSTAETHNEMMTSMMGEIEDGSFLTRPLPERLAYQQSHLEARLDQVKQVSAAVDTLYAKLDETQKKVADEIILPTMGMGMGMGMGRGFGPGMMAR